MKINPRLHKIVSFVSFNLHKILSFVLGIMVGYWINELTVEDILILGLAHKVLGIETLIVIGILFVLPIALFCILAYMLNKWFKGNNKTIWFFLGASAISIFYAWHSLVQITIIYYVNVRPDLPIHMEGYVFPAVYTFKLFRATFFASLFGILGYLNQILRYKNIIKD